MKIDEITLKQKTFCDLYLADPSRNATKAYQQAYPGIRSEKVAGVNAARLLGNARIQAYIEERIKKISERLEITTEKLLQEYAKIAFSDITHYIDIDPDTGSVKVKNLDDESIPEGASGAVQAIYKDRMISENKDGSQTYVNDKLKLKLHDKIKALDSLAKINGLFKEEGASRDNGPDRIIIETYTADGKKLPELDTKAHPT